MASTQTNIRMLALLGPVAAAGLVALSASVNAQQRHEIMFVDDGAGPMFLQMSLPDIRGLRTPDFTRDDLPLFQKRLRLTEVQHLVVETLLSSYLDTFTKLAEESLAGMRGPMQMVSFGDHADDAMLEHRHDAHGGDLGEGLEEILSEFGNAEFDFEVGEGQGVSISIQAGSGDADSIVDEADGEAGEQDELTAVAVFVTDDEEGEQTVDGPSVVVAVGTGGGAEIPEELRKRLEEEALEMAENLHERMVANEEAGLDPLGGSFNPEEHMARRQEEFEQLKKTTDAFRIAKANLKQQFVGDVQNQLTLEQLGDWHALDRDLVRRKTLPQGRLDGERTDLTEVIERLDLSYDEMNAITPQIDAYQQTLHTALLQRNDYLDSAQKDIDKAMQEGDTQKAITIADRTARLRVAVRDVNQQFLGTVAKALGPAQGARFRTEALRVFYPRVYGKTVGQRAFTKASEIDDLDADLLASIKELEAAYREGLDAYNEKLRATIERYQPNEPKKMLERVKKMMEGGETNMSGKDDPIRKVSRERRDYDEQFMTQLYAMLPPEQVERLPKLPSQRKPTRRMFVLPGGKQ